MQKLSQYDRWKPAPVAEFVKLFLAIVQRGVYIRYHSSRGVNKFRQHKLPPPGSESSNKASSKEKYQGRDSVTFPRGTYPYPRKSAT